MFKLYIYKTIKNKSLIIYDFQRTNAPILHIYLSRLIVFIAEISFWLSTVEKKTATTDCHIGTVLIL